MRCKLDFSGWACSGITRDPFRRRPTIKFASALISALLMIQATAQALERSHYSVASWYGEDHRGRLMANGHYFNPDRLTAASWYYALGTKVRVSSVDGGRHSVVVTITDRGPSFDLVHSGRVIDLSHAAFKQLASPRRGLVAVKVQPVK